MIEIKTKMAERKLRKNITLFSYTVDSTVTTVYGVTCFGLSSNSFTKHRAKKQVSKRMRRWSNLFNVKPTESNANSCNNSFMLSL